MFTIFDSLNYIERTYLGELPDSLQSIIIVILIFVIAVGVYALIWRGLLLTAKKEILLSPSYVRRLRLPIAMALFLLATTQTLYFITEWKNEYFAQFIEILWIIIITILLIRLTVVGRLVLLKQYQIDSSDNLKARKVYTQIKVFERITYVTIVVLAIGLSLMTFDSIRKVGLSILTSAGIAGIIIGLAAQKLIGNILAGLQIAITQPIRIDDVVIVENEWGWIEEITLTYTVVRIWDKRRLVLPSTYWIEKPFQNWTRQNSDILGTVFLYLDYRVPVQKVREKLEELVKQTQFWDGKVVNLQVTNLTEKTVELRVLVSAKDSPTAWELRVFLREKLITWLQEEYPDYLPKVRVEVGEPKMGGE